MGVVTWDVSFFGDTSTFFTLFRFVPNKVDILFVCICDASRFCFCELMKMKTESKWKVD